MTTYTEVSAAFGIFLGFHLAALIVFGLSWMFGKFFVLTESKIAFFGGFILVAVGFLVAIASVLFTEFSTIPASVGCMFALEIVSIGYFKGHKKFN